MEASSPKDKELIYSEAEDGKPKPIPVAKFARYFKSKSSNGAIVLREEFKVSLSLLHTVKPLLSGHLLYGIPYYAM